MNSGGYKKAPKWYGSFGPTVMGVVELYLVFVRLAGLEFYRLRRFDLDRLTGLRVSTRACLTLGHREAAEPRELNAALLGRLLDVL